MKKILYLLGFIAVFGFLGGIGFANRVAPYVFGLPFLLFWGVLWIILTSVIMLIIYSLDPANNRGNME